MAFVIKRKTADGSLVDLDIAVKYDSEGNEIPLHYATKEELGAKPGLFYCTAESSGGGDSLLYVSVDTISPSGVKVNDLIMWKGRLYLAYDVSGSVYANFLYDLNGATGEAGADGLSIFSGSLVELTEETGPSISACRASENDRYFLPGDLYLNTGNYNLYKCKSVQILNGSSVWSLVGNIKGEKGDTGASGSGGGISVTPYLLEISEGVDYNILELAAKKSIKVYAMSYGSAHIYDDENTIDLNVTNAEIVLVTADSEVNVGVSGWKCEDGTNMEPVIGATIISSGDNSLHIYSNDVPILLSVLA